jgi:hypothetical protein
MSYGIILSLTSNRSTVSAVNRCRALSIPAKSILDVLGLIGADIELESGIGDIVGVVGIDPSALGHVFLLGLAIDFVPVFLLQLASWLDAVVPRLTAPVTDVASPNATLGPVILFNGDPSDAGCVVVVGNADVATTAAWNRLVYGLFAGSAALDVAAVGLAGVAVALVKGVDLVDRAALRTTCQWNTSIATLARWKLTRLAPSSFSSGSPAKGQMLVK